MLTSNSLFVHTCYFYPGQNAVFSGQLVADHGYEQDKDNGGVLPPMDNIFSLVAESGGKSAMYTSKEKFDLFRRSWPIDRYLYLKRARMLVPVALDEMKTNDYKYVFLHIRSPDRAGHKMKGAENAIYDEAVAEADSYLGEVRMLIESDPKLKGNTAIVLTADHGFANVGNHADEALDLNYQIPFCSWGPGVQAGGDLYEINGPRGVVVDPHGERGDTMKVIRNAYAGVLSADWLGIYPQTGGTRRSGGNGAMADQYLAIADKEAPATSTPATCFGPSELLPKKKLFAENEPNFICSPNGQYRFGMTRDGDLALWAGESTVWSAGTCCKGSGAYVKMQAEGNLVVRSFIEADSEEGMFQVHWASNTAGNPDASLRIDDDGQARIVNADGIVVWGTDGVHRRPSYATTTAAPVATPTKITDAPVSTPAPTSASPTSMPTVSSSSSPSSVPTTAAPVATPTKITDAPFASPIASPIASASPTHMLTASPSSSPSSAPTTAAPVATPTKITDAPVASPVTSPVAAPIAAPVAAALGAS